MFSVEAGKHIYTVVVAYVKMHKYTWYVGVFVAGFICGLIV
jgi:hypothetical protein